MNKCADNKGNSENKNIIIALTINLVALVICLSFFEITPKADDYDMCNVIYGGISGEYSHITLYTSLLYGYLLKGLMTIAPRVSWYYVSQIILIFVSLSVCTWVLLQKMPKQVAYIYSIILLIAGSYEFYIRFTFSKTAGVSIAAGLLLILYFLYQKQLKWKRYILGICLVVFGMLLRYSFINIVAAIFFGAFINFLIEFKTLEKKKLAKRILVFVVSMLLFEACNKALLFCDQISYAKNPMWEEYLEKKADMALLFDYSWPTYNTNKELYDSLNISSNDYAMWKIYVNINDESVLSSDRVRELRDIFSQFRKKDDLCERIPKGIVNFLLTDITFYLVVIAFAGSILLKKKHGTEYPILLMMIVIAGYMLSLGRQRHHTTGIMLWTVAILLLFYLDVDEENVENRMKSVCMANLLVFILVIQFFYTGISSPSYDATGQQIDGYYSFVSENHNKIEKLSKQKENVYIFPMHEALYSLQCFGPFEVYEKSFYSNIIRANICFFPSYKESLKEYGIDNIWQALVEQDNVYYCVSDINEESIGVVVRYYNEHYSNSIVSTKVEEIDDLNVYRFEKKNKEK